MDTQSMNLEDINNIKPINVDTVHKICSGQVVLNLAVAVKELVENSLDAGATNIDIRFKNYGIDSVEVADNGSGVTEDNFTALTLKYHTSKLSDYSDLLGISSFGFRGEALSSLCALSHITITTRHKLSEYATKIEFDKNGHITKTTPCSRQIGTTVTLTNLFHSLPVRHKEFHKNVKREFNKMTQLLYAYCLISLGVKITCCNQTSSNSKSVVVATQGSISYKDNITYVFGIKQLQNILEIKPHHVTNIKENIFKGLSGEIEDTEKSVDIDDVDINLSEDSNDTENVDTCNEIAVSQKSQGYKNEVNPVDFTGFISSCAHGCGRSSTDRQFFYVNSRPCEPTKIIKLINEIYRQFNPNQYPFVFFNINIERSSVDVNVTPDKRKIFLTKEKIILDVLKKSLLKMFESIPRTLKVESSGNIFNKDPNGPIKPELGQPRIFNSFFKQFCNNVQSNSIMQIEKSELKRKSTTILDFVSSKTAKTDISSEQNGFELKEDNNELKRSLIEKDSDHGKKDIKIKLATTVSPESSDCKVSTPEKHTPSVNQDYKPKKEIDIMYLESTDNLPDTQIRDIAEILPEKQHTIYCKSKLKHPKANIISPEQDKKLNKVKVMTDMEDLGKNHRKSINLKTSLDDVTALTSVYLQDKAKSLPTRVKFKSEINPVFNKKCEEELSREISKKSFTQMKVIGQFNLGFIITKLDDDLFIIDQHATDEIYNFETLQRTTELNNQKLVIPQQLELTGVNEQILMENLDVFKKNGFTFEIKEDALPTKRVKLLTIPMSKNWIFGKEDIEELLFMLRESPSEYCRPSRVRAMFASRACRKSVMIGTALSIGDMKKLVDHMAAIDKPWNCPHGRPTIRHLVNLAMVHTRENCD